MTGHPGGMSKGFGDWASGSGDARAVEPPAGQDPGHTAEGACLNCGTLLVGSHCHSCGQRAHVHRTIGAFFHDLLHGVLHFEGKTWHTLPMLVLRPGRLTREYIDGRRAHYVSPIALFLFGVFAMFAVFHMTTEEDIGVKKSAFDVAEAVAKQEKIVARLETELKATKNQDEIERLSDQLQDEKDELDTLQALGGDVKNAVEFGGVPVVGDVIDAASKNPELFAYKLQSYAYKYSWALIPISVPFVWLLFPFSRRFHLYDHTVFVTYSLCFVILLAIVGMVANAAGSSVFAALLFLLPPLHMYKQLKGTYGLGRFGALWRTVLLTAFAGTALGLFFALISAQTGA